MKYPYIEITIVETGEKIYAHKIVWSPGENMWEITVRGSNE